LVRTFLVLALVLVGLPSVGAPRASRARVSANGLHTVILREEAPGRCTLEVSTESGSGWKLGECVGGVDDLYFVSNNGERVWVLKPLVEKGTRKLPGKPFRKVPAWANTVVAELYDHQAGRVEQKNLLDFVKPAELSEVRQMHKHLKWLEGMLGVPGKGPRLSDTGRIEFEVVGGTHHQLTF
jgi:hypothetical protein